RRSIGKKSRKFSISAPSAEAQGVSNGSEAVLGAGSEAMEKTEKTRTHFAFRIDAWSADGENIIEHIAGIEDHQLALISFHAACDRWPGTPLTLRRGARVIEASRRLRMALPTGPTPEKKP